MAGAAAGDTVSVPAIHITLTSGAIEVTQPITIDGAGDTTVVDGSGQPGTR